MQSRFLRSVAALTVWTLVSSALLPILPAAAATEAQKYKAISELRVGGLSIREMKVTNVSIEEGAGTPESESITLRLTGIVSLLCGGRACLSGIIMQQDGSASLTGRFKWDGTEVSELHIDTLKMKLTQWKVSTPIFGGDLESQNGAILTVDNLSPIDIDDRTTQGIFHLKTTSGVVKSANLEIGDLAFSANLASSSPIEIDLYAGSGDNAVTAGNFKSQSKLVITSGKQLTRLFVNHQIEPNTVELGSVSLALPSSRITVADLSISKPQIARTDYPLVPIAAVAALEAADISGKADLHANSIVVANPSVGGLRVFADPVEVAERLNQQWSQDSDPLIATGDPTIHFIQLSALSDLYQGLARADRDPNTLHRIYLKNERDLITGSKTESLPFKSETLNNDEPKICLIFDGKVAEGAATVLTTYLLNAVVTGPMIFKGAYSAYLSSAPVLAPRLGMPAFYSVWGATRLTQAIAGNQISKFITNISKAYCQLFVGHGPSSDVVIVEPTADDPDSPYNLQMTKQYEHYLAKRRAAGLNTIPVIKDPNYQSLEKDSVARARYNNLVELRQKTWTSKHHEDVQQLKSAEAAYSAGVAQRMSEVGAQNAVSGHNAAAQVQAQMEQQRAIQNTIIYSTTPTPSPTPTIKLYITTPVHP